MNLMVDWNGDRIKDQEGYVMNTEIVQGEGVRTSARETVALTTHVLLHPENT